jgi:hypothetical protein
VRSSARGPAAPQRELLLYLDQNYLSGIVKRKVAFRKLEPVLRADLPRLELLRELSAGLRLPNEASAVVRSCERRLEAVLERDFPDRAARASDCVDIRALAVALPGCDLVTCDAFMADVVRRTGLDVRFRCELFTGRRADVERLRRRLKGLSSARAASRRA